MKHVASVVSSWSRCACLPRKARTWVAAKWGRPASPRPAGLGILPHGHRPLDSGSDLLLKSVDSCLSCTRARVRLAALGEAGRPPSGSSRPSVAPTLPLNACDCSRVLDHWLILEFLLTCGSFDPYQCLSVHTIKPTFNPRFRGNVLVSLCPWIEDVARCVEVLGRPAWDSPHFCSFLTHVHLKIKNSSKTCGTR